MEIQLGQLCIIGLKCATRSRSSIDTVFGKIEPTKWRSAKEKAGSKAGLRGCLWGIEPYSEHIDPAISDCGGLGGADNRSPYAAVSLRQRCEFQTG